MTHSTFSAALEALKHGQKVYRASWTGRHLELDGAGVIYLYGHNSDGSIYTRLWNATQNDILTEDWTIL